RFGVPFLGSRALIGDPVDDPEIYRAIESFGLDPESIPAARGVDGAIGFVEFHIEQGPVLHHRNESLALLESIVGQSRVNVTFQGEANHAGTTPMHVRRDALAGAAEWIGEVERVSRATSGMAATVGAAAVHPGAANVIPGRVDLSLDARHASDQVRC